MLSPNNEVTVVFIVTGFLMAIIGRLVGWPVDLWLSGGALAVFLLQNQRAVVELVKGLFSRKRDESKHQVREYFRGAWRRS